MNYNKMSLVSIIIPIFNIEEFINRCLVSVVSQSYDKLEIILVDDGSKDRSGVICDDWSKKDSRIYTVHTEHKGAAAARNKGIELSSGEYIAFIDGDDYVSVDYIKFLYYSLADQSTMLSICGAKCVGRNEKNVWDKRLSMKDEVIDGDEIMKKYFSEGRSIFISPCCKLFHRSLFKDIRFPIGKLKEDAYIFPRLYDKVENVVCISRPLYFYYQRTGSLSNSLVDEKELLSRLAYREYYFRYYHRKNRELCVLAAVDYCNILISIISSINEEKLLQIFQKKVRYIGKIALQYKNLTLKQRLRLFIAIIDIKYVLILSQMKKHLIQWAESKQNI